MNFVNKYIKGMHISERKFREILKYFAGDETVTKMAKYTGINRNTINRIFGLLRKRTAEMSISSTPELGKFEVNESYFGVRRITLIEFKLSGLFLYTIAYRVIFSRKMLKYLSIVSSI
ncbi:hypothetical protein IPN35_00110 [Candidatus Peregrinibacteria bacterium]|nr:MAG: hypothetical protein IPN35_00110 [Candidatus Peregrinibacteria bacterium]